MAKKKRKRRKEDEDEEDEDTTDDEDGKPGLGRLKNRIKSMAKGIGGLSRLTSNDGPSTSKTGRSSKSIRNKKSDRKKPEKKSEKKSEFVPSNIRRSRSAPDTSSISTSSSSSAFASKYY